MSKAPSCAGLTRASMQRRRPMDCRVKPGNDEKLAGLSGHVLCRRAFITLLGGAAVAAWPLVARAQQPGRIRRIGVLVLNSEGDPQGRARALALEQELEKLGWKAGSNLQIDYRWGVSEPGRAQSATNELLRLNPDVILAQSIDAARAAKQATHDVPIVFTGVSEPVALGLVAGLAHPGGNITGFTNFEPSVATKWLELLKQIAPQVRHVALLFNPDATPAAPLFLSSIEAVAAKFAIETTNTTVHRPAEIEASIAELGSKAGSGFVVIPDTFLTSQRALILAAAARYRLPAVYPFDFFTRDGGLLSYGPDTLDQFRRSATYLDRILRGQRPADLPVQQPVKYEFIINLKTAKALGLEVPPTLLAIADEVIE